MKKFNNLINFTKFLIFPKYKKELMESFSQACKFSDLNKMQIVLNKGLNLNEDWDLFFADACGLNKLEIIKFLIESPLINEKNMKITRDFDSPFNGIKIATAKGNLEILKYLFSSPQLKDVFSKNFNEKIFKKAHTKNQLDVVKYLINEQNIFMSDDLKQWIKNTSEDDEFKNITSHYPSKYNSRFHKIRYKKEVLEMIQMIEMKDLKEKLNSKFSNLTFIKNNKQKI